MTGNAAARQQDDDLARDPQHDQEAARRAEDDEAQQAEAAGEASPYAAMQAHAMDEALGTPAATETQGDEAPAAEAQAPEGAQPVPAAEPAKEAGAQTAAAAETGTQADASTPVEQPAAEQPAAPVEAPRESAAAQVAAAEPALEQPVGEHRAANIDAPEVLAASAAATASAGAPGVQTGEPGAAPQTSGVIADTVDSGLEPEAPDAEFGPGAVAAEGMAGADSTAGAGELGAPGEATNAGAGAAAAPQVEAAAAAALDAPIGATAPAAATEVAAHAPPPRSRPRAAGAATADAQQDIEAALVTERGEISAHFAAQRAEVTATSAAQQGVAVMTGADRHAQALGDLDQREAIARGMFASARVNLTVASSTQGATAQQDARAAVQRLRDDATRQRQVANQSADAEGQRAIDVGRAQGRRIVSSARTATGVVMTQADQAVATADLIEDQGDRDAAKAALRKTKTATKDRLQDQGIADHENLVRIGQQNHAKLLDAAAALFKDQDRGLAEVEGAILDMGATLARRFQQALASQLAAIDHAERDYRLEIKQLRQRAAQVALAGTQIATMIRVRGAVQVSNLHVREAVAIGQLEKAGDAAHAKLGAQDDLPRGEAQQFAQDARQQVAAARGQHLAQADATYAQEHAQLAGASGRFDERIDQQRAVIGGALDVGLGTLATALADAEAAFLGQCAADRALALSAYTTVFLQATTEAWANLDHARADWKTQVDTFATEATARADGQLARHAQLLAALPKKLEGVTRQAVANHDKSWLRRGLENAWKHFKSFAVGLLVLLAVIGLGIVVGFWVVVAFAGYMLYKALVARFAVLFEAWDDWSTFDKVLGVIGTIFAAIGDVVGLTYFLEGIFESEAVTGRDLSDEEAAERFWIGLYSLVLFFSLRAAAKQWGPAPRSARPVGELPAGERPVGELPVGERPAEIRHGEESVSERPLNETTRAHAPENLAEAATQTTGRSAAEIGRAIKEEASLLARGKRALIARRVTEAKLSQADAEVATATASEVFGRVGPGGSLPDGSRVVPSVQVGQHQPIFVIRPDGSVFPARATIGVRMTSPPELEFTDIVPD